jgi:hypothetical protein
VLLSLHFGLARHDPKFFWAFLTRTHLTRSTIGSVQGPAQFPALQRPSKARERGSERYLDAYICLPNLDVVSYSTRDRRQRTSILHSLALLRSPRQRCRGRRSAGDQTRQGSCGARTSTSGAEMTEQEWTRLMISARPQPTKLHGR